MSFVNRRWTPDQIRALRHCLAVSQAKLAQQLGMHYGTIVSWEQGRTHPSPLAVMLLDKLNDSAEASDAKE